MAVCVVHAGRGEASTQIDHARRRRNEPLGVCADGDNAIATDRERRNDVARGDEHLSAAKDEVGACRGAIRC